MIKNCPFCDSECIFDADAYAIICTECNNGCPYRSATGADYKLVVEKHNKLLPISKYEALTEFIRYAPHHYECAVEKWRQEFTKDSGPIPDCTCGKEKLRELFV